MLRIRSYNPPTPSRLAIALGHPYLDKGRSIVRGAVGASSRGDAVPRGRATQPGLLSGAEGRVSPPAHAC